VAGAGRSVVETGSFETVGRRNAGTAERTQTMDSLVEAKVRDYLRDCMRCGPVECGTVLVNMRSVARMSGFALDDRFANAGLGAGPEARVASAIVQLALGGGGVETPEYTIRSQVDRWLRTTPARTVLG